MFIEEGDEPPDVSGLPNVPQRSRTQSLAQFLNETGPLPSVPSRNPSTDGFLTQNKPLPPAQAQPGVPARQRASTLDQAAVKAHTRKTSIKSSFSNGTTPNAAPLPSLNPPIPPPSSFSGHKLHKSKPGPARNRDSLDLDDIMNGDDEDGDQEFESEELDPSPPVPQPAAYVQSKSLVEPKSATANVSSDARELLQFLDQGMFYNFCSVLKSDSTFCRPSR